MSVASVISDLQTRHAAITGITTASTTMPASLNTASLPIVLVFPGEARHNPRRLSDTESYRTYLVRCYVAPVAQGQGIDESWQDVITLLDRFVTSYAQSHAVGTSARIGHPYSDSGHIVSEFAGIAYHAFEFALPIREL